jgi:hypothetical protein
MNQDEFYWGTKEKLQGMIPKCLQEVIQPGLEESQGLTFSLIYSCTTNL